MIIKQEEINSVMQQLAKLYKKEPFICLSCKNILSFKVNTQLINEEDVWLFICCPQCQFANDIMTLIIFFGPGNKNDPRSFLKYATRTLAYNLLKSGTSPTKVLEIINESYERIDTMSEEEVNIHVKETQRIFKT
jgi:hypothetical protein